MAKIVEVILTDAVKGRGDLDPVRRVAELYTRKGTLLAWLDSFTGECNVNPDAIAELESAEMK